VLLSYFGEVAAPCGNCDLCDTPPDIFDATQEVRMALSAILRTGERFGGGHVIDVLTGQATDRTAQHGHEALLTYGVGKGTPKAQWQAIIRQMLGRDLIRPDPERHGALRITEAAHPVLRGEVPVLLRRDLVRRAKPATVVRTQVDDEDAPLLSALKAKRRALAEAQRVPAYVIFPDRTLIEMAQARPQTRDAMARVNGVGARKLESYGEAFLQVIAGEVPPMHPARRSLAGRESGDLYDRLAATARQLARGEDGTAKPLSLTPSALKRIAQDRPGDLSRYLDQARLERFGTAFRAEIDGS
jgi:ATP-dependent DNA helicase RecQ